MDVAVDDPGIVRLTWAHGLKITEQLANDAMSLVDQVNAGAERPLLVDLTGTATLTRPGDVHAEVLAASMIALLGQSPVDRTRWRRSWTAATCRV
jgi:hypothetical protein